MIGEDVRSRRTDRQTVEMRPSPWQSEADIEAELDRGEALGEQMLADGVQSWKSHYRWWGPVKVLAYKEVGPPPWRFPRVGFRRKGRTVRLIAGWRSTAFAVLFSWQRKPRHIGRDAR